MTVSLRPDLALVAEQIPDGSRVLDLGCGSGTLLAHLMADRSCTGWGVEIDAEAVLVAIRRGIPVIDETVAAATGRRPGRRCLRRQRPQGLDEARRQAGPDVI